jgi:glycosyltransferase involved in cell wall biosynthesis
VQSENLILSVGSITPHKNQLTLLEAFQEYVNDNPDTDWRLLLVGGVAPELQSRVESIVQQCSAICVESQMGDAGLFDAYRRAAFTVFPSVAEGYGLPIVESLWFGKPCVCANFGAMAEVAEGGGCLSINIRDKAELQQAIRRLIDSEALREELSAAAGSRHFETWEGYASKFVALISEASNGLRQLGTVFYPVTHTCQHPRNSGIQRVVRGLARSLIDNGVSVVPVMFDENDRVFAPVPQERLDHLSQWNGPSPDDWSAWKNPSNGSNRDWMLCAELTHGYTAELIDAAKSSSLRAAYVFYDAIPYKMTDIYPPEASIAHERYMAALNSCELVLPISQFSRRDLLQFLGKSQFATPNLFERVRACILPGEFLEHDRVLDDGQRTNADANQERVARILSVGTVEPRKNHLTLLKAFELVRARAVTRVELCIAGGGPFDNLAEEVEKFIEVTPGVTWERSADDSRLRELYEWCDFTVYPSLEEGFGLPIVESIWNGKPCVCHNDGAMSEVAGPGCVRVDAASVEQLSTALIELVESGEALTSLAAEAIKAEIKTWQGYGAEVGSALANERQPIPDQIEPARSSREDLYSLMPNITQRPLLSICISTYNRARWLTVSLHHLSRLIPEYSPDIEIVVCDNASTDDTPAVVEPYLSRQDFAYHRNPHNVGMLGNLRVTAHHAKGKYIWILGDDDLLRSGAIDKVVHTLHSNPDLALVYLNYAFHREDEPSSVDGIDALFNDSTPVSPPSGDEKGLVCEMAANSENFFTAIYCLVFRRDHALRAYSEKTDGRPFAAMRDCIPTTYYVLHHMMNEQGAWLGQPQLTVNLNVSWMKYATLWILERLPEAHDLAEKMGADRAKVDEVRAAHFPHVAHWFEVIYADDPEGNAAYFKPDRLVSRVNHLRGFKEIEPHLRHIYSAKRQAGHPACHLPAGEVFYDEPPSAE